MTFLYCDSLKELANNPTKMNQVLMIDELDKMIHEIYPDIQFKMNYSLKEQIGCYGELKFRFEVESAEDMTKHSGIFANVLESCKIDVFNTYINWSEEKGFNIWFDLHLSYTHFRGGSNGMKIADFFFENGHWNKKCFKDEVEE